MKGKFNFLSAFFNAFTLIVSATAGIISCTSTETRQIFSFENSKEYRDSVKCFTFLDSARFYMQIAPDTAGYFLDSAMKLSQKNDIPKAFSKAITLKGILNFTVGNYKEARQSFYSALNNFIDTPDSMDMGAIYMYLGHLYNFLYEPNIDSCKYYYQLAENIFKSLNDQKSLSRVYNGLASRYYLDSESDSALIIYQEALKISESFQDSVNLGNLNQNIGLIYISKGIYIPAIDYLQKALKYTEPQRSRIQVANLYNTLGQVYFDLFDFSQAEMYYSKAIELFENMNETSYLSLTYDNFGHLFAARDQDSLALEYYLKSLKINENSRNTQLILNSYVNIADILLKMNDLTEAEEKYQEAYITSFREGYKDVMISACVGLSRINTSRNKKKLALNYGLEANNLAVETGEKEHLKVTSELLAGIYAKNNDYKKAYEYYKIFKNASDSLFNDVNVRKATAREIQYEYEKKFQEMDLIENQRNEIHKAEIERQRIIRLFLIILSVILFILFITLYLGYKVKLADNRKLSENQGELKRLNDDLEQRTLEVISANARIKKQNRALSKKNVMLLMKEKALSESNAAKDKFFSIIAHDLKNPLNSMIGFSDLLISDNLNLESQKQRKYISLINSSSKDLYKLLENLLEWSRSQTGKIEFSPETFFLSDVVNNVTDLFETSAYKKGIEIQNRIDSTYTVFADIAMVNTVFRNLISNALKFTPENGKITIKAEDHDHFVKILISDTGVGIPEEDQQKLFRIDESYTTSGTSGEKGTGLGLTICKEFILKNKGKIGVESKVNQGSIFWITLHKASFL